VPDFGVYIEVDNGDAGSSSMTLSRQMVLFCVERRKAWRLMQSRAGVINPDYEAQKAVRAALQEEDVDGDRIRFAKERFAEELAALSL
jgi:pyruvate-ferredoxin/flavodoxin oxidoreductase